MLSGTFLYQRHIYHQPTKLREGNVLSYVCLSVRPQEGSNVTITHGALYLTVLGSPLVPAPAPQTWTSLYRDPLPPNMFKLIHLGSRLLVTSGGQDWRPLQTCLLEDPLPTSADI